MAASCLAKVRGSFLAEAVLPTPDHRLGLARCTHNLSRAMTIGSQKHDPGPPDVLLRAIAVRHSRFERAAVSAAQSNVRSLMHSPDSHVRVRWGILTRIEMSDLVH
jgi:hypothetical protein